MPEKDMTVEVSKPEVVVIPAGYCNRKARRAYAKFKKRGFPLYFAKRTR